MGFLEILTPPPESRERVKVPNELFLNLVSSYQTTSDGFGFISVNYAEQLVAAIYQALNRPPSRILICDNCTILIDRREVVGLTTFQKTVLIYIQRAGSVSIDTLLDEVWKKPDGSKQLCYTTFTKINAILERYGCEIANKDGKYGIEFFRLSQN